MRPQDVLVESQEILPEILLASEHGCADTCNDLKTVEHHGDEQKTHLAATVNPLPCARSVEVMLCDDVEAVHALEQDSSSWRLGLAVTKKTGCAVQRNRIKRVLREFFRLHQHELPEHVDIVVVPKKHLRPSRVSLQYVTKELLPLFVEIHRYTLKKSEK